MGTNMFDVIDFIITNKCNTTLTQNKNCT